MLSETRLDTHVPRYDERVCIVDAGLIAPFLRTSRFRHDATEHLAPVCMTASGRGQDGQVGEDPLSTVRTMVPTWIRQRKE